MAPWRPLSGLVSWCHIFKSSYCNGFQDRTSLDFVRVPQRPDYTTGYQYKSPSNGRQGDMPNYHHGKLKSDTHLKYHRIPIPSGVRVKSSEEQLCVLKLTATYAIATDTTWAPFHYRDRLFWRMDFYHEYYLWSGNSYTGKKGVFILKRPRNHARFR